MVFREINVGVKVFGSEKENAMKLKSMKFIYDCFITIEILLQFVL